MATDHSITRQSKVSVFIIQLHIILLFSSPLHAQINASQGIPTITNYTATDFGAGGQQIWSLSQDQKGYMYIGTNNGMLKFDGKNWDLLNSPLKGFNSSVRAMYNSSSGLLYYGSLGDFGFLSENKFGTTIQVSLLHLLPEEFVFNDIWSIQELDGKMYFQAREAIFIYTPPINQQEESIEIWKPDTRFMYSFAVDGIFYTHQMDLGLYRQKEGILELIPGSDFFGNDRVQVLLPYHKPGEFLVGAFSGGLFHFDGKNFIPFKTEIDDLFNDRGLYEGIKLSDNAYALGLLGHGLFIIDPKGKIVSQFSTKNTQIDESIYSLFLDVAGTLWVGTNNGISKIEISSPLTRFASDEFDLGSLLSLNALDDNLYIGGSSNVFYLDKSDGKIKKIEGIPNSQIFDLKVDGDQMLSGNVGIYAIKGGKSQFIPGTEGFQLLRMLISKKHPGYVFLSGAFGIHVMKRSLSENGIYQYESIGNLNQIERYIYTLEEDPEGDLWGGTQAGVLFRVNWAKTASGNIDLNNTTVRQYSETDEIPGVAGRVAKINGKIYASGIMGFYYFDKPSDSFVRDTVFSFSNEVADINLDSYALQGDDLGRVLIDFKNERKLAIPNDDGTYSLQDYPINLFTGRVISAFYSEPSGVIWLGSDHGLIRIDNQKSLNTDIPFPVYFNRIISNSDTLSHKTQNEDSELHEMEFKNNSIRFAYAAPFYIQEKLIRYQTFLEGFDQDWGKWEENTFREFTNLPYGKYKFKVRAKNIYNSISDEITYQFVILPPWYATWWAYILYFLALGLIVFGLVKVQTGRILAREKEKNRQKELAHAREIEKAYEDLKATQAQLIQSEKMASLGELTAGIAHEIQNPLNFVKNFTEVSVELVDEIKEARSEKREARGEIGDDNEELEDEILEDIKKNLEKIHHHGKRADAIVKGMLAHSRNSTSQKEDTDLNALADEYMRLSYHGLRAKDKSFNADFKTDFDPNLPMVNVVAQDIGRVLLNLINNAFFAVNERKKMGEDGYKPMVTVNTKRVDGKVLISVIDNGTGIPDAIKDKIFQPFFTTKPTGQGTGLGLSLSYDIIKAHGGEFEVEGEQGKGSEFIIKIPVSKNIEI